LRTEITPAGVNVSSSGHAADEFGFPLQTRNQKGQSWLQLGAGFHLLGRYCDALPGMRCLKGRQIASRRIFVAEPQRTMLEEFFVADLQLYLRDEASQLLG
jgi:hypothetical protein